MVNVIKLFVRCAIAPGFRKSSLGLDHTASILNAYPLGHLRGGLLYSDFRFDLANFRV